MGGEFEELKVLFGSNKFILTVFALLILTAGIVIMIKTL